jgi:hypothetical protein
VSLKEVSLPVIDLPPSGSSTSPDLASLHDELARSLAGEVRADRLSRALYSTDASVYQIVPACVVLPATSA